MTARKVKARVKPLAGGWYAIYHPSLALNKHGKRCVKARNPKVANYRAECLSKLIPVEREGNIEWELQEG